jgi:hypothetical protein
LASSRSHGYEFAEITPKKACHRNSTQARRRIDIARHPRQERGSGITIVEDEQGLDTKEEKEERPYAEGPNPKGRRTPKKTKRCQKSSPALPSSLIKQQQTQKPQAPLPANNNNGQDKDNAIDICSSDESWEEPQAKEPSEGKKTASAPASKQRKGPQKKATFKP